jgi:uncharacterized protein YbjT (DUF2867 family)
MTTLLIVGATGLVGGEALILALADARIKRVIAPTRRPLLVHEKLLNPIIDFENLQVGADWWTVDGAISALGTTRARAGSAIKSQSVDFDYPLKVAKLVRKRGGASFAHVSTMGANANSYFLYIGTKGELEQALNALNFPSITFVRPGLIGGRRNEFRLVEQITWIILRIVGRLLPRRYRINPAVVIARALLDAAISARPGRNVTEADRLTE